MERVARGFDPPAVAALRAATGGEAARHGGDGARARGIAPKHHDTALALQGGTGLDVGVSSQRDGAGLGQRLRPHTGVGIGATLPVTPHQHLAAPGGAAGVDVGAVQQLNVFAQQECTAALAAAPSGAECALAHDGQAALARRIGQGLRLVWLRRCLGLQQDVAALCAAGVQHGVVQLDVALRGDVDLAAL